MTIWMALKASVKKTSNLCRLFQNKHPFFILKIKHHWRGEWCDAMSLSYTWIEISESKLAGVKSYSWDVFYYSWSWVYTINIICEVLSNTMIIKEITNEDCTSTY